MPIVASGMANMTEPKVESSVTAEARAAGRTATAMVEVVDLGDSSPSKAAVNDTHLQEMTEELEALRGASQLETAQGQVDDLIAEALYQGAHTAFTSVTMHYNGVNFATVGSVYARDRTSEELMQLREMVAPRAKELVGQISPAVIRCKPPREAPAE